MKVSRVIPVNQQLTFMALCFLSVFLLLSLQLSAQSQDEELAQAERFVQEAALPEKGDRLAELAILQAQRQYQAQSFRTYLQALESLPETTKPATISQEDKDLYQKALTTYLDTSEHPVKIALALQEEYGKIVDEHPDYYLLNFIVASSYANLGKFADYFERFYRSAKQLPDHYLVDKACGMLSLKLSERESNPEQRETLRAEVVRHLRVAQAKDPRDMMVYKVLFQLWSDSERHEAVAAMAKEVIDSNIQLGRSEILPFVRQLVEEGELAQAQELINRGKQWYEYSRSLNNAQKLVDRKRNG